MWPFDRRKRKVGKFEGKGEKRKFLTKDDVKEINNKVREFYEQILSGRITKDQAKYELKRIVIEKVHEKTLFTHGDMQRSGLMHKIDNYVKRKLKKIDEDIEHEDLWTGKTTKKKLSIRKAGKIGDISRWKKILRQQLRLQRERNPNMEESQAYTFLMEFCRSRGIQPDVNIGSGTYRHILAEVVKEEYETPIGIPPSEGFKKLRKEELEKERLWGEGGEYEPDKVRGASYSIKKTLKGEEMKKGMGEAAGELVRGLMGKKVENWEELSKEDRKEVVKNIKKELEMLWDSA